jgi:hypothetical protein
VLDDVLRDHLELAAHGHEPLPRRTDGVEALDRTSDAEEPGVRLVQRHEGIDVAGVERRLDPLMQITRLHGATVARRGGLVA